ncbi:MAG TPA: glycoside hydrolase family 76 protein [Verrucomicrobiae bacterium]|nr:glycoside hydrolase family 76 protein [Verrucomicrobiae bacterium]
MRSFFYRWRGVVALLVLALVALASVSVARAFTPAEADTIFSAYTKAFYFTNEHGGFFHATTEGGKTFFWDRAEEMEMLLDTYERSKNPVCLTMFSNVFTGFVADHGATWERNEFNDDIMWMVIACARAHQLTGNPVYREAAKANFDLCYARAWSTNLGGGLWWKITSRSKNACVNGPASIAASLLHQISGDTNYLAKAQAIYAWEREKLFDPKTGAIWDNMNDRGEIGWKVFSYNLGTFIGAANFLGQTNDARLAADYAKNVLCHDGILPGYNQSGDTSGFNGIFARWMVRYMKDRGLQPVYQPWLQANADAAWSVRRPADNLSWPRWRHPTPEGPLDSWACSSSVVMMQVVPASEAK